jgi:hypothetical protein
MASQYVISTGNIALVANTAKVILEIPTTSTKDFDIIGLELSFSYSAATIRSCVVEWMTYATTGTGTTVTAAKYGKNQGPAAILGTVKVNHTAAPGTLNAAGLPSWVFALPGMYSINYPYGREMYQPVSTNRCLRLTSTFATNVRAILTIEQ